MKKLYNTILILLLLSLSCKNNKPSIKSIEEAHTGIPDLLEEQEREEQEREEQEKKRVEFLELIKNKEKQYENSGKEIFEKCNKMTQEFKTENITGIFKKWLSKKHQKIFDDFNQKIEEQRQKFTELNQEYSVFIKGIKDEPTQEDVEKCDQYDKDFGLIMKELLQIQNEIVAAK